MIKKDKKDRKKTGFKVFFTNYVVMEVTGTCESRWEKRIKVLARIYTIITQG